MGHVLQKHQMLGMRSEQGLNHFHPNDCMFLGSSVNSTNQSTPPVIPASRDSADHHLQVTDPYRRNCIHGNHYNGMQYCQPVSSNYVGEVAPANFYNPCMASSSSRLLSIPTNKVSVDHVLSFTNQRAFGTAMNDGRDNYVDSLNEPGKRKDAEVVAANFDYYNGVENSKFSSAYFSLNSELPQWQEPYNYGGSRVTAFTVPGCQANGILTATGDSQRLVKDRSSAISLQPVPPFSCYYNYLLQGNQMDQSFQPSSNALVEQFGNYVGDWRCSTTYMHGTCLNAGHLEVADTSGCKYQGNSSNTFNMHNPSFPNAYRNYSPAQITQVQSYSHHTQMPAPSYWHPFDNLHTDNVYSLRDDQESRSRFVGPMPSISEQMYAPPIFGTVPGISYDLRNPPFGDASKLMEFGQFHSFEDSFDQYGDMRMDIDDMSYEELLDLEEKIGDVKTGLSEEFILKNLRTSMYVQQSTSSSLGSLSQSASENGTCMVCQVEYAEKERIGTLDCRHSYHADCIKQWLYVKNICPICKAPALLADKKDG